MLRLVLHATNGNLALATDSLAMLPDNSEVAVQSLRNADPGLSRLIDAVGAFALPAPPDITPFQSLMNAVLAQQISRHAADAIRRRLYALFPGSSIPTHEDILACPDAALRGAGISRNKVTTIRTLASKAAEGYLPHRQGMESMETAEIVDRLTALRGIGIWTAEMLLIFYLGRPDILPVTDLGIRRGFKIAFELEEMPKPRELAEYGQRWKPYRSVASWYLWRANDL